MAETLRDLTNGTIGPPYRDPLHQGIGTLADLINAYSRAADHVGVTMPEWSPVLAGKSLTLRDLTTGDLGNVLEDISYGMGPMRGGNYATGGIGTYGLKPDAMELGNAIPLGALATKGVLATGRKLAPTAAEMLRQRAEKYMRDSGSMKEIIAYHGTPHNWQPEPGFPDGRFRLDKMGTGEGAQAYGWGAYFAEFPEVARTYSTVDRPMLHRLPVKDGKPYEAKTLAEFKASNVLQATGDYEKALARIERDMDGVRTNVRLLSPNGRGQSFVQIGDDIAGELRELQQAKAALLDMRNKGVLVGPDYQPSVYELDIPDEAVARMLDWDAPLSGQSPIVRQHFEPIASPIRNEMAKPAPSSWGEFAAPQSYDPTGQELLGLLRDPNAQLSAQSFLANALGENVSRRLRDAGIPGLRFLDAGSRGAGGSGTRNIVVWDQDVLDEAARRGVKKK